MVKLWKNTCSYAQLHLRISTERLTLDPSKEHIFSPLGMTSTSFYLTDERRKNAVSLAFRGKDGNIESWTDKIPLIEQDPEKGAFLLCVVSIANLRLDSPSSP